MSEASGLGRRISREASPESGLFPRRLGDWIESYRPLLDALLLLRDLGADGSPAAQAVLKVRTVARLKASWALWEVLVSGEGHDPDDLIMEAVSWSDMEAARYALWGSSWEVSPQSGLDGEAPEAA